MLVTKLFHQDCVLPGLIQYFELLQIRPRLGNLDKLVDSRYTDTCRLLCNSSNKAMRTLSWYATRLKVVPKHMAASRKLASTFLST